MIIQTDYEATLRSYRAVRRGNGFFLELLFCLFRFSVFSICFLTSYRFSPSSTQEAGLERYAIAGAESDWGDALVGGKGPKSGLLSVKRKAGEKSDDYETPKKTDGSKKEKKENSGKKSTGKKSGKKK
ncbi:hypothetical protein OAD67_03050 [bacterium]|nr:hypothetical protein [bacterium]